MATYTTFDAIIDGHEGEETALDYARGMVWGECSTSESTIAYGRHVDTIDGVGVYYDFGADYYFFTDELDPDECCACHATLEHPDLPCDCVQVEWEKNNPSN